MKTCIAVAVASFSGFHRDDCASDCSERPSLHGKVQPEQCGGRRRPASPGHGSGGPGVHRGLS